MAIATDDEIIVLETAYWQAIKDDDFDATMALTHDPCIVAGPQGAATFDHSQMEEMNSKKDWALNDYSIDNMNVVTISDHVAVLGYSIKLDLEVEGKPLSMECAESSTWVKEQGKWQCVQHSETPLGDPYARDKKPTKKK